MRFSPNTLLAVALVSVAPTAWLFGLGIIPILLVLASIGVAKIALNLRSLTRAGQPMRLESISASPYVEKVRWCLDRLGADYQERHNVGILGLLVAGRTVPVLHVPDSRTRIGNSRDILRYLWGRFANLDAATFLEPTPEALELETEIDRFGVYIRGWAYGHLLDHRSLGLQVWGVHQREVPLWQRLLLRLLYPLLRLSLLRLHGVNERTVPVYLEKATAFFDRIDERLADGRAYLLGGTLSFVDIAWAALAMPAVLPSEYGGGAVEATRLRLGQLPEAARAQVQAFRERPGGQLALRLYRDERNARPDLDRRADERSRPDGPGPHAIIAAPPSAG